MADYYLVSVNGKLSCSNGVLLFSDADGEKRRIFPHLVDSIIALGPLNLSASAMAVLMENGIELHFLSSQQKGGHVPS